MKVSLIQDQAQLSSSTDLEMAWKTVGLEICSQFIDFFLILDILAGVLSIQILQSDIPETEQTKIAITEDSETVFRIIVALLDAEICRFFLSCFAWNTL